jgi:hypothetical protein
MGLELMQSRLVLGEGDALAEGVADAVRVSVNFCTKDLNQLSKIFLKKKDY